MEIAFYILLVSWVILLTVCIMSAIRIKTLDDINDVSLDTVTELTNQLDAANEDLDHLIDKYRTKQKVIDNLNKLIGNMKATEENGSILYVNKGNIEYVTTDIDISANVIKDITEGRLDIDQVEDSLRFNIQREIINEILPQARYYVIYDIEKNSYNFKVRIPVVALNSSEKEYSKCAGYPLTNILLDKVKED